jgi:hypothetical protein
VTVQESGTLHVEDRVVVVVDLIGVRVFRGMKGVREREGLFFVRLNVKRTDGAEISI